MTSGHLRTAAADLLGIDLPIVQAPVGRASVPALAAAVSNAGALGSLALSWSEPAGLRRDVEATRRLTSRPFAVNLVLIWDQHDRLTACLELDVRVVSTFWGDPAPYVPAVHAAGAVHVHSVGSVAEAIEAAAAGVDIIVAQGSEAGGHVRGEVSTLALVPAVVDAVHPLPVLAAGGIADGRGIAAALMLGAQGAWLGTRFLLCQEADTHDRYREALVTASGGDSVLSTAFDGGWPDAPHRTLRNSTFARWDAAGRPAAPNRPGEGEHVARSAAGVELARYAFNAPTRGTTGDVEAMALYAGQGVGLATDVPTAGELVQRLAAEAEAALRRTTGG
jgi:NAD(P)H-dependent flavin oxidoreductase YrpB (nitropropane dioxygenase family)